MLLVLALVGQAVSPVKPAESRSPRTQAPDFHIF
jgi:hypothetical protein